MCAHYGHWSGLYIHHAVADRPLSAVVLPGAGLRAAAPLLDAESASAIAGGVSFADVIWTVQPDPTAAPTGAGADQLPGGLARAFRLPEGAPAALPNH